MGDAASCGQDDEAKVKVKETCDRSKRLRVKRRSIRVRGGARDDVNKMEKRLNQSSLLAVCTR